MVGWEGDYMRHYLFTCCLLIVACHFAACATVKNKKQLNRLDDSLRLYEQAIRWGEFDVAARYIKFRENAKPAKPRGREILENIRVASYEVISQGMADDRSEARVLAAISFYHVESGIVRHMRDEQVWWYDEQSKSWFLEGDLPNFAAAIRRR